MMKNNADKLYPAQSHSFGSIITALVDKQLKDPKIMIKEIQEQKRALAKQIAVLDEKEFRYREHMKQRDLEKITRC